MFEQYKAFIRLLWKKITKIIPAANIGTSDPSYMDRAVKQATTYTERKCSNEEGADAYRDL